VLLSSLLLFVITVCTPGSQAASLCVRRGRVMAGRPGRQACVSPLVLLLAIASKSARLAKIVLADRAGTFLVLVTLRRQL
jgi:hypothetical protein